MPGIDRLRVVKGIHSAPAIAALRHRPGEPTRSNEEEPLAEARLRCAQRFERCATAIW